MRESGSLSIYLRFLPSLTPGNSCLNTLDPGQRGRKGRRREKEERTAAVI